MRSISRNGVGAALLILTGVMGGQGVPPGSASRPLMQRVDTMTLDYRDVPVDEVLTDLSSRLDFIVIRSERIAGTMTLVSDKPVGAWEAAALLNEALWPLGFRLYKGPVEVEPVLRVVRRPSAAAPGEMRVWRRPAVAALVPLETGAMAGISATATMKMQYASEALGTVVGDLGRTYGFVVDPGGLESIPVTLLAGQAVDAGEAVGLVSEFLAARGRRLQVNTVEDAMGDKRSLLRVLDAPVKMAPAETVTVGFDDAPLPEVLGEIGRRSGYAVTDATSGVRVTIHDTLKADAVGADVGPLVARLNEKLLTQGAVVEETSRATAEGKREAVLAAMPVAVARKTVLAAALETASPMVNENDWVGVDKDATMRFRYEIATVDSILADVASRFGFIVMKNSVISPRITARVPQPVKAGEAVGLLDDFLMPLGYTVVTYPAQSVKGTILRVVGMGVGQRFGRTGSLAVPKEGGSDAGANPASRRPELEQRLPPPEPEQRLSPAVLDPRLPPGSLDPPLPPGSVDDLETRMLRRRAAEISDRAAQIEAEMIRRRLQEETAPVRNERSATMPGE
jgi:hypothetical protein